MVSRKPEAVVTSSRINIFTNFQILYLFSTIFSQMEVFTTSRNGFQKAVITSSPINIFEKFQILYVFSTVVSQMEAFTTSKNGFQKTGSSYNFVANHHFRKISIPVHVFDYCQSDGSVYDLQSGFQKTESSYNFVPNQHFRKNSNLADVFNYGQASYVT